MAGSEPPGRDGEYSARADGHTLPTPPPEALHLVPDLLLPHERGHEILSTLAEGGMGIVHVARDPLLGRRVALKTIKPDMAEHRLPVHRFVVEARITAQLDHPQIVPVHAMQTEPGKPLGYTMKLVRGQTLKDLLQECREQLAEQGTLDEGHAQPALLEILIKVCDAVHYAHMNGILHRDLKPANIMVGRFGEVYVMDWGIARSVDEPEVDDEIVGLKGYVGEGVCIEKTQMGHAIGTPGYMSPEQARGDPGRLDYRSDQYALGLILAEAVTLRPPIPGFSSQDVLDCAQEGVVAPLRAPTPRARLAPELVAVVRRATANQPQDRYPDVAALADDLRRFLRGDAVLARPENPLQKLLRAMARHRIATLVGMVLIILGSAGVVTGQYVSEQQAMAEARRHQQLLAEVLSVVGRQRNRIDARFVRYAGLCEALSAAAEQALHHGRPVETPLYHENDFDHPETAPPDLTLWPLVNQQISLGWVSVVTAPGVTMADVQSEMQRLAPVRARFQEVFIRSAGRDAPPPRTEEAREIILHQGVPMTWSYLATESGLMFNYPGVGGFPDDYDPRQRPWYLLAASGPGIQWGEPYPDILEGNILLSCVTSVRDEEGNVLAVVGADMALRYLVGKLMPLEGVAGVVEVHLLDSQGRSLVPPHREDALERVRGEGMAARVDFQPFPFPEVGKAIARGESGYLNAEREGRRLLIVYERLDTVEYWYTVVLDADELFGGKDD